MKVFNSQEREEIYRSWIRINKGGTLRQFRVYLQVLEEYLEVRGV